MKKIVKFLSLILGVLILIVCVFVLNIFVLQYLWSLFCNSLDLPELSFSQMSGLYLFIWLILYPICNYYKLGNKKND